MEWEGKSQVPSPAFWEVGLLLRGTIGGLCRRIMNSILDRLSSRDCRMFKGKCQLKSAYKVQQREHSELNFESPLYGWSLQQ